MVSPNCVLDEVYGAIREIEDEILLQKRGEWKWGLDGLDSVEQTLFSSAFLVSIGTELSFDQKETITQLIDVAEDNLSSSAQMFHAFSVGLASCVRVSLISLSNAVNRLMNEIEDSFDSLSNQHQTGILFGLALFRNLIEVDDKNEITTLLEFTTSKAKEIVKNFTNDRFQESRIQLLYVLSSIPDCVDILKELHKNHRRDVEFLRDAMTRSDERVLLLKPYSILNVDCHRTMISEVMNTIRTNDYSRAQKNILHRISLYFSYFGQTDCEVELNESNSTEINYLQIGVENDDLHALKGLSLNAKQIALIGLGLVTSGFLNVYIVPMSERSQYIQFKRDQEKSKHSLVETGRSLESAHIWAETKYKNQLGIAITKLLLVLFIGYVLYLLLSILASSGLIIFYLIYQTYATFGKAISGNSRSLMPLIYSRNKIKKELSLDFLTQLGL